MSMKLMQLKAHWDADDAYLVITFLDELRDLLWVTYGEEIMTTQAARALERRQTDLPFDDEIEF